MTVSYSANLLLHYSK